MIQKIIDFKFVITSMEQLKHSCISLAGQNTKVKTKGKKREALLMNNSGTQRHSGVCIFLWWAETSSCLQKPPHSLVTIQCLVSERPTDKHFQLLHYIKKNNEKDYPLHNRDLLLHNNNCKQILGVSMYKYTNTQKSCTGNSLAKVCHLWFSHPSSSGT